MKHLKWTLLLSAVLATTTTADARPRRVSTPTMSSPQIAYSPAQTPFVAQPMTTAPVVSGGGVAQQKAEMQASSGRCFHPGGSLGGGTHEGCGFSSVSADDAIRHCCYWGQRTPIDIGVARGANGWYATVLYR